MRYGLGLGEQNPTDPEASSVFSGPKDVDLKPFDDSLRDNAANEIAAFHRDQGKRLERAGTNPRDVELVKIGRDSLGFCGRGGTNNNRHEGAQYRRAEGHRTTVCYCTENESIP